MAAPKERMKNLNALFADGKTRMIIIFTGGILLLAVIVGVVGIKRSNQPTTTAAAAVRGAPNITSVPGARVSSKAYTDLQQELNVQRYQTAAQTGGSSIPTVVRTGQSQDITETFSPDAPRTTYTGEKGAELQGSGGQVGQASGLEGSEETLLKGKATKPLMADLQQQQQITYQPPSQEDLKDLRDQMTGEAQKLMASWNKVPRQSYVTGSWSGQYDTKTGQSTVMGNSTAGQKNAGEADGDGPAPVIKAGDIVFAVLKTEINSDQPGPVLATIVSGPLKGSRIIGSIGKGPEIPGTNGPETLILNFNRVSMPNYNKTIGVSAVAIDPDTARTSLASDVDHHYLLRYGTLFASSFLSGYADAITQAGSVSTSRDNTTTTTYDELSGRDEFFAGLGEVGQSYADEMGDVFNRENTIVIYSGTGIGLLFLNDVQLPTSVQ